MVRDLKVVKRFQQLNKSYVETKQQSVFDRVENNGESTDCWSTFLMHVYDSEVSHMWSEATTATSTEILI